VKFAAIADWADAMKERGLLPLQRRLPA
jgi:hypothetical protein